LILQNSPVPRTRRFSGRSVITAAKEAVLTIDLADRLCGPGQMRKVGKQWSALCPLPDHEEKTPSFTVDPAKNLWFCHGCLRGGDVVRLARDAWGYLESEDAMAAAELLHEFGHEIPPRPASWHRRQSRQEQARRAIEESKISRVQRRIYRWILAPPLANIADETERLNEARHAWEDAGYIARLLVYQARGLKPGEAA
jgi:hypothetical protein